MIGCHSDRRCLECHRPLSEKHVCSVQQPHWRACLNCASKNPEFTENIVKYMVDDQEWIIVPFPYK